MKQIIECIPNFSEGRDINVINQIAKAIKSVHNVSLLHLDIGYDANRTVMTFAGEPNAVVESAFRAIQMASQLIDMSNHKGEHPRIGATDVCPLVPISGISMKEVVSLSYQLASRIGGELNIPIFCYEESALQPHKRNLANCRKGEYEGIEEKLLNRLWEPDYGPKVWNKRSGISIIGARKFLIAYNATLDTENVSIAKEMAQNIRTTGRRDKDSKECIPGLFKELKAIGWYMSEYRAAQISMNLTDFNVTGIHTVIEEIKKQARKHNCQLKGSELIGLIPLKAILDAGIYYAKNNTSNLTQQELIHMASKNLLLNYHERFNPDNRIIEYAIRSRQIDF